MRIFIVGYMFSGKTTLGRMLAERTGMRFIDLDLRIEHHYRCSIPTLFSKYGEDTFRLLEMQMLRRLISDEDNFILSTGGGTPCFYDNMSQMTAAGITVYLSMSVEAVCQRAEKSRKVRPLLAKFDANQRRAFIENQLQQRTPYYSQSQHRIAADHKSQDSLVEQLLQILPPLSKPQQSGEAFGE